MPMKLTISQWGNGLGLHLPKAFVEAISAKKGDALELESSINGDWIIRNPTPKYDLDTLLQEHSTDSNIDVWGDKKHSVGIELL